MHFSVAPGLILEQFDVFQGTFWHALEVLEVVWGPNVYLWAPYELPLGPVVDTLESLE